jgi:transposase
VRAAREQFEGWLTTRKESGIEEPAAYARGLEADYASFKAGLQLAWSSGQTEGQVNTVKLIKRQMYERRPRRVAAARAPRCVG